MSSLFKVSVITLVSAVVVSCGVLEPQPDAGAGSTPAALPGIVTTPSVVPSVTGSGQLVVTNADGHGSGNGHSGGSGNGSADGLLSSQPDASTKSLNATTDMDIVPIFQTDRCNTLSRGGFIWFTDQIVLDDWLSPLQPEEARRVTSQIDFSKQGALLLDYGIAGSKGSGATIVGDGLGVGDGLEIVGQNGIVRVKQFESPKNKKSAQVVTHPCSLFVMSRIGFSKLVILSDMDDELTSFDNK